MDPHAKQCCTLQTLGEILHAESMCLPCYVARNSCRPATRVVLCHRRTISAYSFAKLCDQKNNHMRWSVPSGAVLSVFRGKIPTLRMSMSKCKARTHVWHYIKRQARSKLAFHLQMSLPGIVDPIPWNPMLFNGSPGLLHHVKLDLLCYPFRCRSRKLHDKLHVILNYIGLSQYSRINWTHSLRQDKLVDTLEAMQI